MKEKKNRFDMGVIILIVITMISLSLSLRDSYSKFLSTNSKNDIAYIATFAFETTLSDNISVKLDDMKPGDLKSYNFKVSNSKDSRTPDVDINYELTIKTSNNLPLTISLYKNGDTDVNKLVKTEDTVNQKKYKMNIQIMSKEQVITDIYELRIEWKNDNKENKSDKFVDELDYIDIYIDAVQVEPEK